MIRTPIAGKGMLAAIAAMLLLAGCASTPAPVVNHSFGSGGPPGSTAASGVSTNGIGSQTYATHANGTITSAGYVVAPGDTLYSIAFANGLDFRALATRNAIPPPYVIHPGQVLQLPSGTRVAPATQSAQAAQVSQPAAPVFGPVVATTPSTSVTAPTSTPSASASVVTPPPVPAPPRPVVVAAPTAPGTATTPAPPPAATRSVGGVTWRWPASGKLISRYQAGSGGDGAGVDIAGKLGDPVRAAAAGTVVYSGNGLIGYGELVIIKHSDTYLSAYGHNSKRLVKEGERVSAGQEIALMGASGAPRVELHFEIRKNGKPVDPMDYLPNR